MAKNSNDTFGSEEALNLSLDQLFFYFKNLGVRRVYEKKLSSNDNSKNQIYLGGNLDSLQQLRAKDWIASAPDSRKKTVSAGSQLLKGKLCFNWVDSRGNVHPAPESKLILYPQYPEVRLSGILRKSDINLSNWMDVNKCGRSEGRYLIIGIDSNGECFAYFAVSGSRIAGELEALGNGNSGGLKQVSFAGGRKSPKHRLIEELKRIHNCSPISGKRLDAKGNSVPCSSPNAGGYTLEAELGIIPDGDSGPDYEGWEVKAHSQRVITLLTPEPSFGVYVDKGVEFFVRTYGYAAVNDVNRLNFGGVHRFGKKCERTGLTFGIEGYDRDRKDFELDGGLVLTDENSQVAAGWSFRRLLTHWERKHSHTAFVEFVKEKDCGTYFYMPEVLLGEGGDFLMFLAAIEAGSIYYDPGIKIENINSNRPKSKRRSQFRINVKNLPDLFREWEKIDVRQ
ncbi:MAG: MvaI/BcnI family restriction endonuclease [Verrucomicrobiales bacterium]|nr:MvaI/BcnI family restriction endonuclease [Verrucomicrobiales bacterium]